MFNLNKPVFRSVGQISLFTFCGMLAFAASATTLEYSSSPGLVVADGAPGCNLTPGAVATDIISVPSIGTITDLDLDLDISHEWVGDLVVQLTSPEGTTVTVVELPGNAGIPGSGLCGCSADDISTTLDDESGGGAVEAACPPTGASYTPENALTAFDGEELTGNWTLSVQDWSGAQIGTVNSWAMNITFDDPTPVLEFCPGTVSGSSWNEDFSETGPFRDFVCRDRNVLYLPEGGTYELDQNGNLVNDSIQPDQADFLYRFVSGFAEFTSEDCAVIDITATDEFELIPGDGQDEVITRRFSAQCGAIQSPDLCFQTILIEDCQPYELDDPTAIPANSRWSTIALILSILGMATYFYRRRYQQN